MASSKQAPMSPSKASAPAPCEVLDAVAIAIREPQWEPLEPHLQGMLKIIPKFQQHPERTSLLTWVYLAQGRLSFERLVVHMTPPDSGITPNATVRRNARRAVAGLVRIGAVVVVDSSSDSSGAETSTDDRETSGSVHCGLKIEMTKGGMTWMKRAWAARYSALKVNPDLNAVHQTFLDEEEEGKGNEAHWIESMRPGEYTRKDGTTTHRDRPRQDQPPCSRPITSVFDLGNMAVPLPRGHLPAASMANPSY